MACFNHLVARRTTSRPSIDAALLSPFHAYLVKTFFLPAPNQAALGKKSEIMRACMRRLCAAASNSHRMAD
jgi:hypothetical protein